MAGSRNVQQRKGLTEGDLLLNKSPLKFGPRAHYEDYLLSHRIDMDEFQVLDQKRCETMPALMLQPLKGEISSLFALKD